MKWLKRKIRRWLDNHDDCESVVSNSSMHKLRRSNDLDSDDGINMTVRYAVGGRIVSFRTYESKTDRHNYKLYVIPDDQDFERELGKIITLESMRY
jgi:hypothetical protein